MIKIKAAAIAALVEAAVVGGCGSAVNLSPTSSTTTPPSVTGEPSATLSSEPSAGAWSPTFSTAAPDRRILGQTIAFTFDGVLYTAKGDGSERTVVTDFPGIAEPYASAFWSPNGDRLIVRMEDPIGTLEGGGYVFGVDPDGSDLTKLSSVSGSHFDAMPGWSPDGSEIVYAARKPGDAFAQIYVMKADGSNPRKLLETKFETQYPAWSTTG